MTDEIICYFEKEINSNVIQQNEILLISEYKTTSPKNILIQLLRDYYFYRCFYPERPIFLFALNCTYVRECDFILMKKFKRIIRNDDLCTSLVGCLGISKTLFGFSLKYLIKQSSNTYRNTLTTSNSNVTDN